MYNNAGVIKVHYYYYRKSRDASWQILKDTKTDKMPVSVLKICRSLGITVLYHKLEEDQLGKCVMVADKPYILLREDISTRMKRFVCAHELGHILLEHFESDKTFDYKAVDRNRGCENGAEAFAMRLIATACVLWGCRAKTVQDIVELCGIEKEYAEKRLKRLKRLCKRNKFLTCTAEKEVYDGFMPFINEYTEKHK